MSEADGADEKAQMVGLLRHFAEVFGAGEVYREARAILLETVDGARILEEEYGRVRDEARMEHDRQTFAPARGGERTGGGKRVDPKLEEARRLLGG